MTYEEALKKRSSLPPIRKISRGINALSFVVPENNKDFSAFYSSYKNILEIRNEHAKKFSRNRKYLVGWFWQIGDDIQWESLPIEPEKIELTTTDKKITVSDFEEFLVPERITFNHKMSDVNNVGLLFSKTLNNGNVEIQSVNCHMNYWSASAAIDSGVDVSRTYICEGERIELSQVKQLLCRIVVTSTEEDYDSSNWKATLRYFFE